MAVLTWFFFLFCGHSGLDFRWAPYPGVGWGTVPAERSQLPLVWATVGDRMTMDKLSDRHGRVHGSLWDLVQLQPPLRVSVSPTVECVQYLDYLTGWRDAKQVISWLRE